MFNMKFFRKNTANIEFIKVYINSCQEGKVELTKLRPGLLYELNLVDKEVSRELSCSRAESMCGASLKGISVRL